MKRKSIQFQTTIGDAEVTVNADGSIWVKSADTRRGFSIGVSDGPHGLSVTVSTFAGTAPLDRMSYDDETRHHEFCQYRDDERSQAFRRWYLGVETDGDIAILGPEYRRGANAR